MQCSGQGREWHFMSGQGGQGNIGRGNARHGTARQGQIQRRTGQDMGRGSGRGRGRDRDIIGARARQ